MPVEGQDARPLEYAEPDIRAHHVYSVLSDIRQLLAREDARALLRDDPRRIIDEWTYQQNVNSVNVHSPSDKPVLVNALLLSTPNGPGVVTFGSGSAFIRTIPVPQGTTYWPGLGMFLRNWAGVTLTATTPGDLFLEVMGRQMTVESD